MCGLAGLFDVHGRFAHRGRDDDGVWLDPHNGLAKGRRRISIIDLSAAERQPMVYRHVPRALVDHPKVDFTIPLEKWLREPPLRDWVESLLPRDRLEREGFFETNIVRTMWDDHVSCQHDRHYELWDILMFQAWLDNQQHSRQGEIH